MAIFDSQYLTELDQEQKEYYSDNYKFSLIKSIFGRAKYYGTQEKVLLRNSFYFNDTFDHLYNLDVLELEKIDNTLNKLCLNKHYNMNGE